MAAADEKPTDCAASAPSESDDLPRLWAISHSLDDTGDRIEPGDPRWRSLLLLAISSEDGFTEPERRALAERLVDDAFRNPVLAERRHLLVDRGVEPEQIRREAVALVVRYCWERGGGEDGYSELLGRIHRYLGHRISKRFVGPDEHRERKSDAPAPTAAFADLEADEEEESDDSWLSRQSAPGEVERRAAEDRWALMLDLEDELRSAAPEEYAEDLRRRMMGGPVTDAGADADVTAAVWLLLDYRRTEATVRERAVIDAMLSVCHETGKWNAGKAHDEHYEPPAPEHEIGRRQFAEDWSQIRENIAAA